MKPILILLALFVAIVACDPYLPESWRATPEAGYGRGVGSRLQSCINGTHCEKTHTDACYDAARADCLDAGFSRYCGENGASPVCRP